MRQSITLSKKEIFDLIRDKYEISNRMRIVEDESYGGQVTLTITDEKENEIPKIGGIPL